MMRILIVEDHPVVRRGLKEILDEEFPGIVYGEAADSQTALDAVRQAEWNLIIVDINLPGRGGLEFLRDIRGLHPLNRVLVVSAYSEEEFAIRVFRLGAAGFVNKSQATDELAAAVKKVLSGRRHITPSIAERLADSLAWDRDELPHERLSPRELQILRMIAEGKTAREIAEELSLSEKTVATYRTRIGEKIGVSSNVQLARYAYLHGLAR